MLGDSSRTTTAVASSNPVAIEGILRGANARLEKGNAAKGPSGKSHRVSLVRVEDGLPKHVDRRTGLLEGDVDNYGLVCVALRVHLQDKTSP